MKIFDAHADTVSRLFDEEKSLSENDIHIDAVRLSAYESYTQVFAAFIAPEYKACAMERAKKMIARLYEEADGCGITICKNYDDWAAAGTKVKAFISLEGGEPISSVADVKELYDLGVRMLAPTWNYRNELACGVAEEDDTGLTELGARVIREMNRLKIITDVSHLSEKSFWDVAKISQMPIVASHSNSRAVTNHRRNLTDAQFMKIKETGGCVGINFYPPFLGDEIADVVRHIDHFIALGGEDNVGFGSDFDGVDALPCGIRGAEDMERVVKMLPYSAEVREKIAFRNFLRVIKAHNC